MVQHAGPEELKWPNKALYTYNVQEGDKFILDEKVPLTKLRTNSGASMSSSTSPKIYGSPGSYRTAVQFGLMPYRMSPGQRPQAPTTPRSASGASRNLFGRTPPSKWAEYHFFPEKNYRCVQPRMKSISILNLLLPSKITKQV